jgi:alcohol dehydrogenase class IV
MFIAKKIYCRAFQSCFKLALPILPYRNPKILNDVKQIPDVLIKNHCDSVLIVTDKTIMSFGLTKRLEHALKKKNIHYAIYDKTVPNPTTENVSEALKMYTHNNCQALIGFGGGSSMDCAKAVGARLANPDKSLGDMKGILKVGRRIPLLIAVPSTAGTGSEATLAAVIVDSKSRYKYAIMDFPLIPKYAVLDPRVTLSLPPFVTATTGMDALTHAVEAYIGNSTTHATRKDAIMAVKLIFENLETAVFHGDNIKARANMLKASFYAGCAFSESYVGYVHAVAHSLGGEYNIAHGYANAVILPYVLEEYGSAVDKKLHDLAMAAGLATPWTEPSVASAKFIAAIKDMQQKFSIGNKIKGIKVNDIPRLAQIADKEANPLYPVPVLMDAKRLEKFYYLIME